MKGRFQKESPRERLVRHVHELERLTEAKQEAAANLAEGFKDAQRDGFDPATLKVVLKLRQMTPSQRRERRALEAIYLGALGMLEGEPLPDSARKRLDGQPEDPPAPSAKGAPAAPGERPAAAKPEAQPPLALKDPDEARREGGDAAAAGKRIYDNPYPAGDPCRAAWDEGWCAQRKSHGMDPPTAYQRRTAKPGEQSKGDKDADDGGEKKGAA